MKNNKVILVFIIFLSFAFSEVFAGPGQEEDFTKTFPAKKGEKLQVRVNPGNIIIKIWDKNEVLLKVEGLDEKELSNLDYSKTGSQVKLSYNSEWGWSDDVDFIITVPSAFDIELMTTGGDIDLRGSITGDIRVTTSGGDIRTSDISGKAEIHTSGGDIRLGNISGNLAVSTQGGDIEFGNVSGERASVRTMGGDIEGQEVNTSISAETYGGDVIFKKVGGRTAVQTYGGDIRIGASGGSLDMQTYGGDIELGSSKGDVRANTAGGDIELRNIKGSIRAKTASGEIYAELDPEPGKHSELNSSSGEIELVLPRNAKATVSAEIYSRGWWDEDDPAYEIRSDFDMGNRPSGKNGNSTVTFDINGGGHQIKLETVNSDIKISKEK